MGIVLLPRFVAYTLLLQIFNFVFAASAFADPSLKKNVIIVLYDDTGWTGTEVGPYPSDFYETPNLSALAAQGVTYTNAYSPAAICSPTRGSMLTGRTPAARHETENPSKLDNSEVTFAEAVKTADSDYRTAFFGKWHIVLSGDPGAHGFDVHDGETGGHPPISGDPNNPKDTFGVAGRAVSFMEESVTEGRPFVLFVSFYATHTPMEALAATIAKYQAKVPGALHSNATYAAMTEDLDAALGEVLVAVSALGISDRTYIVVTSDNGHDRSAPTTSLPLRDTKVTHYEGGVRVPFVVAGPGILSGGTDSTPVIGWDIAPTVLSWLDMPSVPVHEGVSLEFLSGGERDLIWHYPHCFATYTYAVGPRSAIRRGDWKLVRRYAADGSTTEELYNLTVDIGETTNLSFLEPIIRDTLSQALTNYLDSVDAEEAPLGVCKVQERCGIGFELVALGLLWPLVHARRNRR